MCQRPPFFLLYIFPKTPPHKLLQIHRTILRDFTRNQKLQVVNFPRSFSLSTLRKMFFFAKKKLNPRGGCRWSHFPSAEKCAKSFVGEEEKLFCYKTYISKCTYIISLVFKLWYVHENSNQILLILRNIYNYFYVIEIANNSVCLNIWLLLLY